MSSLRLLIDSSSSMRTSATFLRLSTLSALEDTALYRYVTIPVSRFTVSAVAPQFKEHIGHNILRLRSVVDKAERMKYQPLKIFVENLLIT